MTERVETATEPGGDEKKDAPAEISKNAGKSAAKSSNKTTVESKAVPTEHSAGAVPASAAKPTASDVTARKRPVRFDPATLAIAAIALAVGTGFGMATSPRERTGEALTQIGAGIEAGRAEAKALSAKVEEMGHALAAIRDAGTASDAETRSLASGLAERIARLEQDLSGKLAGLSEMLQQAERAKTAPAEARPATSAAPAVAKTDPTQTASIAEAKPTKTEPLENWTLRDVYEGVAILEDRKRRLLEVAAGETIPGLGRVEAIERRERTWVVVTKQGLITPQAW